MLKCPTCGSEQPDTGVFCDQCGAALQAGAPQAPRSDLSAVDAPATADPPVCLKCGRPRVPGAAFCHICGAPFPEPEAPPTARPAPQPSGPGYAPTTYISESASPPAQGPSPASQAADSPTAEGLESDTRDLPELDFASSIPGSLLVCDTNTTICFPSGTLDLVIGRQSQFSSVQPDIDLAGQGGAEKGVSRQHARIFCRDDQVYIQDLESSNGTYVNQERLKPRVSCPLHNGDTIWLGHLKMIFDRHDQGHPV